ncbi:AT-hook DNA-binding protein [Striga asiatica]|uniref:AT-hook DNA-binding protein n=1 Tax=Striga asiatica TaxID=4170 RepID=A0A5A7Q648_STRAF|nr:AT-hook DNA-binding protein [Striga asiatica]
MSPPPSSHFPTPQFSSSTSPFGEVETISVTSQGKKKSQIHFHFPTTSPGSTSARPLPWPPRRLRSARPPTSSRGHLAGSSRPCRSPQLLANSASVASEISSWSLFLTLRVEEQAEAAKEAPNALRNHLLEIRDRADVSSCISAFAGPAAVRSRFLVAVGLWPM